MEASRWGAAGAGAGSGAGSAGVSSGVAAGCGAGRRGEERAAAGRLFKRGRGLDYESYSVY